MADQFESKFVDRDGFRFHYTEHGQGKPLILLHGGGPGATGLSNYRRNLEALGAHYKLYVLDMPGFGKSSKEYDRAKPFEQIGKSIRSFMDGAGIEKASVIGNSLGGSAAVHLAIAYPERVDRIVLMGPGGGFTPFSPQPSAGIMQLMGYYMGDGPSIEKMRAFVGNLVYNHADITPDLLQERYQASIDPEIIANPPLRPTASMIGSVDLWRHPGLAGLPHRTLVIWGMEDRTNTPDSAFSFARIIPNAELYLLPKCGHWAQWEKPNEFHDAVLAFLARP